MTDKTRNTLGAIGLALGLVALMLILTLTALHSVGTDDGLYYELQTRANVLPAAGISDEDLRTLDAALARYLAGQPEALLLPLDSAPGEYSVLALKVNGELRPAFNEKELRHLDDCYRLFALLRKVRQRLIPWAVLLILAGAQLLADRRRIRRAAWLSPLLLFVPLGAFALWAVIDFDAAFTFFHRVLFTNDLWLLDPRTDLLIRICPASMFMSMGLRIGLWSLAAMVAVPALAALLTAIWPKSKENGANPWNDNRTTRRAAAPKPQTFDFGGKR